MCVESSKIKWNCVASVTLVIGMAVSPLSPTLLGTVRSTPLLVYTVATCINCPPNRQRWITLKTHSKIVVVCKWARVFTSFSKKYKTSACSAHSHKILTAINPIRSGQSQLYCLQFIQNLQRPWVINKSVEHFAWQKHNEYIVLVNVLMARTHCRWRPVEVRTKWNEMDWVTIREKCCIHDHRQ